MPEEAQHEADRHRAAVLLMAKAPRAGEVKTRLEPLLGPDGCARLQAELLRRTARWASDLALGHVFVAYAPRSAAGEVAAVVPDGVELLPQVDGDLGRRLLVATEHVLDRHAGPLVVVGTDTPALGRAHVLGALERLRNGADVCFGPAVDGGYYLVAIDRPHPAVFSLEPAVWGGPAVLEHSLVAARRAGLAVSLLGPERDLDDPEDAAALLAEGTLPAPLVRLLGQAGRAELRPAEP